MLINTSSDLSKFCDALRGAPYIAVDTDVMREKSYYARLCPVQVAYGEHAAAIDPLAEGLDMGPLRDLLCDPTITKVLHSATQDLEIFLDKIGEVPGPVFDTQIAATVCGLGEQPGYAKLVSELLKIEIDKASQRTDWSLRPLSKRQLEYALGDVTHLCKVYELLVTKLEEANRSAWVVEEMTALLNPARYHVPPENAWRRIKIRRPDSRALVILRELAKWREETARLRDIPRNWVVRDDALIEIAQNPPKTVSDLARVRSLKPNVAKGNDGEAMLDAITIALDTPREDWPVAPKSKRKKVENESLVALLQALLQCRCETHKVAASVVAKRADLNRIATEKDPDIAALKGWRRVVFGADALELCAGRLALGVEAGEVVDIRS